MEIIIFQLLSCLYFYDSGIEVPVCIRKPSRSTVYQLERSYTVPSVNRLPAGAFIYRAVGQQTPGSVGSLRKVGRPSPGVQRVNIIVCDLVQCWGVDRHQANSSESLHVHDLFPTLLSFLMTVVLLCFCMTFSGSIHQTFKIKNVIIYQLISQ